ncbi:MAG: KH domain-containing protein [Acidimicrobiia bacterium]
MSDDQYEDDDDFEDDEDFEDEDDEIAPEGNRAAGGRAKAVVEHVARHLVDDADGVFVDANERNGAITLLVHASPGDMGRIIGKRGRVIQALRQVGRAAGSTEDVRITVDVAE